ncbi:IS66 family insertion sequence element accessory protein TnpA [Wenzhouxiangella sp. AB-CW3]|uniref:IS66 family insertion sequence element accessory protein TnpA n=1 Tax=Wenzhouxiangella sp. AB-CW3 TaxID=2771012 RepID=UPI00398C2B52
MSRTTRIRRSADQWRSLISKQADSGLTQSVFCRREGLSLSTFCNWKRKLSSESDSRAEESAESEPWIDLGGLAATDPGWDIELDLGNGVCLRFRRS